MKNFKITLISDSSNLKFLRIMALFLIFGLCVFAFNWNFKNKVEQLNSIFIVDKFKKLSKDEVSALNDIRMALKSQTGIGLDILIVDNKKEALLVPALKVDKIFIGVNVGRSEAVLIIPMLVKKAVGEGNRAFLEDELANCLQNNMPFQCIANASSSLFEIITKE